MKEDKKDAMEKRVEDLINHFIYEAQICMEDGEYTMIYQPLRHAETVALLLAGMIIGREKSEDSDNQA